MTAVIDGSSAAMRVYTIIIKVLLDIIMTTTSEADLSSACNAWTDHLAAGLDSSNASRVVDILSALASAGVTVIITIHQPRPDILRLMDRMLLLSGNGQVTFFLPHLMLACTYWLHARPTLSLLFVWH